MAESAPEFRASRRYNAFQVIFAITAFILMWIGDLRCNFIKFTSTSGSPEPLSAGFGMWYYRFFSVVYSVDGWFAFESCHGYPDYVTIDGSWMAARTFSILTFIFAMIVLIAACFSSCTTLHSGKLIFAWEAPLYLLTALCQGLTLLFLSSSVCKNNTFIQDLSNKYPHITFPDTCSLDTGAKLSISAMVFFFAASVSAFFAHKAEKEEREALGRSGLTERLL